MAAGVSLDAGTSLSSRFSVNSSGHTGKSRNRFSDAGTLVSSLRFVAGFDEVSSIIRVTRKRCRKRTREREEPVDIPGSHFWFVDSTCLFCCNQTHFASAVGHDLVDPKCRTRSIMEKGFM